MYRQVWFRLKQKYQGIALQYCSNQHLIQNIEKDKKRHEEKNELTV